MAFKLPNPELNIPTISGDSIQLSLGAGDRIFIVGANGSGKSALIQHFVSSNNAINVRRVPAHRQTSFHSDSIDITLETRLNLQEEFHKEEQREQARWIDRLSEKRQSAILFDLVDQANLEEAGLVALLARLITRKWRKQREPPPKWCRHLTRSMNCSHSDPLQSGLNFAIPDIAFAMKSSRGTAVRTMRLVSRKCRTVNGTPS